MSIESVKEQRGPKYMLDTSSCAAILTRAEAAVLQRLDGIGVGDAGISAVTLSELMAGVVMSRREAQDRAALEVFLRHVPVLDYPAVAATHYAGMREILHWREAMIGPKELLVAAHARSLEMTLVTGRTRELKIVPGMEVESWNP